MSKRIIKVKLEEGFDKELAIKLRAQASLRVLQRDLVDGYLWLETDYLYHFEDDKGFDTGDKK